MHLKITRTVNTGRPGWEYRLQNIPESLLEFEANIDNSNNYSAEYDDDYLDDENVESMYDDIDDPDRI